MKYARLFFALVLTLGFWSSSANGQALVKKDFSWYLRTSDGIYPAVDMMGVFTPSGNILHKQVFMIDLHDSLVPEKGVNKVAFITWVPFDGEIWTMIDAEGIVYPNGKCIIIFHSNGAGTETPTGKGE